MIFTTAPQKPICHVTDTVSTQPFSKVLTSDIFCIFISCVPLRYRLDLYISTFCILIICLTLHQESDLLSLARSLLQAWVDPLVVLSTSANTLPHPAQSNISNKIQELQQHSKNLGDGLDILSGKVCQHGKKTPQTHFVLLCTHLKC